MAEAGVSAARSLSTSMKLTLAFMVSSILYLFVGVIWTLLSGPFDIYAAASLIFALPYLVFLYFGLKARRWAYLGSSVLSVVILVLIALTLEASTSGAYLWETILAALLSALNAVGGFKGYLELGGRPVKPLA